MICADSSIIVKWIFRDEELADRACLLLDNEVARGERIIAPPLLRDEFTNVVRKKTRQEDLAFEDAYLALALFFTLPIMFRSPHRLHHLALRFAIEQDLPATYDAEYVALARGAGCPLWTADQRLIRTAGHLPFVRPLSEYEPAP